MIDADETGLTEIDFLFCDLTTAIHQAATGWLKVEGWQPPLLDFYAPPQGTRRTVWASVCYAVLSTSAEDHADRAGPKARMAAQVLVGLRATADALATPGANRQAIRAAAFGAASATAVLLGQHGDILAEKISGLANGPSARAATADLTWRNPLSVFLDRFLEADPLRASLPHVQLWRAFLWSNPGREAQARAMGRQWPTEDTASREVARYLRARSA